MAAAPQQGAHLRGVQAAAGADGQLAAPLRQLPDGDGGLHPLNLSQEGGDILHILLSCARLVHEGQGHGGHSDFPALIAVHPLGEQPLHLEPRPALGAEVALVEGEHVDAGVHQGGGHPVGVRCGIAVLKAAGVGGHGHIQGYRHGGGDGAEFPENVVDQLAAGGPPGVQAGLRRKKRLGGVVVDGQINPPRQPGFSSPGEQAAGGDVHAHHRLRNIALRGQAALQIGGEQVGLLRVGTDPRRPAQGPQPLAQGGGAADGVPVGALVGEDQIVVMLPQKGGGLLHGHGAHSSPSSSMWALAGLAGLTTSGLRSMLKMWAPVSMESSSTNCSSGV